MITAQELQKKVYDVTYTRGRRLYRNGSVLQFSEDQTEQGRVVIKAQVRGSTGHRYKVEIAMDGEKNRIIAHHCSCPAHTSYSGPCKHCVAVLLEMIEMGRGLGGKKEKEEPKELSLEERLRLLGVTRGYQASDHSPDRPKKDQGLQSTYGLNEILKPFLHYGGQTLTMQEPVGQVKLEPHLILSGGHVSLTFKIGITQMYVLKNLSDFANRIRIKSSYRYGKKLEFLHSMEMFTEESRPFAELIVRKKKPAPKGYYYGYVSSKDNEVSIEREELDEVMALLEGRTFGGEFYGYDNPEIQIVSGHPDFQAVLKKKQDGAEFVMKRFAYVEGENYLYFWKTGEISKTAKSDLGNGLSFFLFMQQSASNQCNISKWDLRIFLEEILPDLEHFIPVKVEQLELSEFLPETPAFELYLDLPEKNFITCQCFAVYEKGRFNVWEASELQDTPADLKRNWKLEAREGNEVKRFFKAYSLTDHAMAVEGEEDCYRFLTTDLEQLGALGEVFISDRLKKINIRRLHGTTVGISLTGNLLNLTLDTELSMDELVEILSKYDRKKKYYRLKNGDFIETEQSGLDAVADLVNVLQIPEKALRKGDMELPKYRALYLDERLGKSDGLNLERERSYKSLVRNMKTVEDSDFEVPASLRKVLRGYQKKGFLWLKTLSVNGFGGILADDMGLGKTLQVIAFLLSEMEESKEEELKRTLIVAPASLIYNWENEIHRFAPALNVKVVAGNAAERKEIIGQASKRDILVTSYDLLKRDEEEYENLKFFCQVLDEAQYIKNFNTKGARAAKSISAGFKVALTGTPMENRLSELWSIFDYLMPGFLYSYERFKKTFEAPIVKYQDEDAVANLQRMIRPFILRRIKKDVLKDLPDKLEKNMFVRMEEEQEKLYQAHVQRLKLMLEDGSEEDFGAIRIKVLSEITKLRQLCCNPGLLYEDYEGGSAKEELCMELLENAIAAGHKILLFSQFTSMLHILEGNLAERGIAFYTLTGETPKERRIEMMNAFNKDETPVFLISLKAGGTGLNLVGADMVIHYDPWWNAAAENQATDRAHRIGQKHVVTVYKLVTEHTIEEKVLELQQKKKELTEQVLGGKGLDTIHLDRKELLELFD